MNHGKMVVALMLVLAASAAHAQSSGAQAETLFREGRDLMAQGKFAEACAAFDASQRLDPTIATLLNQAACREKNGQLATAWGEFLEAERQTRGAADDATRRLHQVAASRAARLEPRLSTLTIAVSGENRVAGLEILRNGEPVDPGTWNRALPVDGGTYEIIARAPGIAEWSGTITVGNEHDVRAIELPRLAAATPRTGAPSTTPRPATADHPRRRRVPLALAGGALALAGGAVGLEIWGSSTYARAKTEPDNARQLALWHSANARRYVAEGLGAASLACAGVAVWLYLRAGKGEAPSPSTHAGRIHLVPIVASDRAGLLVMGRY